MYLYLPFATKSQPKDSCFWVVFFSKLWVFPAVLMTGCFQGHTEVLLALQKSFSFAGNVSVTTFLDKMCCFLCKEHCYSIAIMLSQKQGVSGEDTFPVGTDCAIKGN